MPSRMQETPQLQHVLENFYLVKSTNSPWKHSRQRKKERKKKLSWKIELKVFCLEFRWTFFYWIRILIGIFRHKEMNSCGNAKNHEGFLLLINEIFMRCDVKTWGSSWFRFHRFSKSTMKKLQEIGLNKIFWIPCGIFEIKVQKFEKTSVSNFEF